MKAKLSKTPADHISLRATVDTPYQGIYLDFAFSGIVQKDKDGGIIESTQKDVEGLNGETSWILISDAFTRMMHGDCRLSKASPIKYLKSFLEQYSPEMENKWVVMDQGGELYNNPEVVNLFKFYKYKIYPTGADASHQNGPVERGHRSVLTFIKSLLIGAGLETKFWPYAFMHVLRIRNAIPGSMQVESPIKMSTGEKDNLKHLKTFGCRVWVRPPGIQARRFKDKARKGIFLGYVPFTTRNILWFDVETERVKVATHCLFDEGFNNLPIETLPPNDTQIIRVSNGERPECYCKEIGAKDLDFSCILLPKPR